MDGRVVVVGGGLAGLCCALHLMERGVDFVLLEADERVGGRIKTDILDGFRLDCGFQIFLTSYPEAKKILDYKALGLRSFTPGALVRFGGNFHYVADPFRRPFDAIAGIFSPVGSLIDKFRVGLLRESVVDGRWQDRFREKETTTLESLGESGFSSKIVERFFRPFLGGVFLESDLTTSSRFFRFVFRMFSLGESTLPAEGMEAIPKQIAARLPEDSIRLGAKVVRIEANGVEIEGGEFIEGAAVVVAAEGHAAARLLGQKFDGEWNGTTCIYFAADEAPEYKPILILNGEGSGPINNICFPANVAPSYSPSGKALISVTLIGAGHPPEETVRAVRGQLTEWYGGRVDEWEHLRTYEIPFALPRHDAGALSEPERPVRVRRGVYVCGDHRDNASIQGAMVSGRRAAEAVLEDLR